MNPLEAETLRLLQAIREAKENMLRARIADEREQRKRQDLLYFRHREQGKR